MSSSEQEPNIVKGKTFTESFHEKIDVVYDPEIRISQPPYLLDRADFIILMSGDSKWSQWAMNILFVALGFALTIIAKYLQSLINKKPSEIESWELLVVGIAFGLSFIFYIIGKYWSNERTQLIKKMKEHFASSSKSVEYRKRK